MYAKQWWKEYLAIREIHKERLVKIFAQVSCYCYSCIINYNSDRYRTEQVSTWNHEENPALFNLQNWELHLPMHVKIIIFMLTAL